MHSDRGEMNIIYKVIPLWPTLLTIQKTRRETTRRYGGLFSEFWKEKGKKGDLQKNHKPFKKPTLIIYFPKIKLFAKRKKFYKIRQFRNSGNKIRF